jgi:predicted signal transduction protein with EAL and GGDEF domain
MIEPGACADELFVRADCAMYEAKRAARLASVCAA